MIIYIEPKSLFPQLSSDTIYGAIFSAISNLYEDFNEFLDLFKKSPPFLISSAFPYIGKGEKIHFFPKPIGGVPELENMKDVEGIKKLKKVKYIHESIFNKWIIGHINEAILLNNIKQYEIKDGLIYPKELNLDFNIDSLDNARNSINRLVQSTDIYYSSGKSYKNAGIFFLVRFADDEAKKKYGTIIKGAVKFLEDRGIGEDVSSGKGHFEIMEFSDKEIIQEYQTGNRFISLSRYHPTQEELKLYHDQNELYYDIFTKRGRSSDGRIRKQVRFFTEGSTFPSLGKEVYGELIPVDRKAIEFGYAYNVRMKY